MLRNYLISLVAIAAMTTPARSQGVESAFLVGYGVLSIGAVASLASRGTPPVVEVGTRLKVRRRGVADWSSDLQVVRLSSDSMVVATDSGTLSVPRSEIDSLRIKVSTGRWAEGWGIGLLAGGAAGAAVGYASIGQDGGDDWFTPGEGAVIGGIVFGVTGSILGAGIGVLAPSRWVTIGAATAESRLSITPTIGRRGFVAQFRF